MSKIAAGVDVRGDGGYVIVPPSRHVTGRTYAWSVDSVDELVIGPEWLVQLARAKPAFRSLSSISEQALARIRPRGMDHPTPTAVPRSIARLKCSPSRGSARATRC